LEVVTYFKNPLLNERKLIRLLGLPIQYIEFIRPGIWNYNPVTSGLLFRVFIEATLHSFDLLLIDRQEKQTT